MQSDTLPAFDGTYWASLVQDMSWLPSSSSGDLDFEDFMDFGPELGDAQAFPTSGFRTSDELEPIDQYNTPASPEAELEPSTISISTVFNLDRVEADGSTPDFYLIASDGVHFAVNAAKLRENSINQFGGLLASTNSMAAMPLSSTVLNMLLHTIYGLSAAQYAPAVDDLAATIDASEPYGLSMEVLACHPTSPLFEAILSRAPSQPLECYSLAAHAKLEDLAGVISPYTLSLPLPDVTEENAECMGPSYLRRLFFLHLGRMEALKRILRAPPTPHPPTEDCDGYAEYLHPGAWVQRVGEIVWGASPNISSISLETRLSAIGKETDCTECQHYLAHRVKKLVTEWSLVKNTI
ncbi:hypothetical protein PENSPDRAFT_646626 [Peniophora sp. CONT]|nr:hypothetical protein PENSPDRAFT_646626 [Peniophora sp. CONT]